MLNRLKFAKVRKEKADHSFEAGTLAGFENHAMKIAAKGGYILAYEIQPEGKSRMSADAFANGAGRALLNKRFE